MDFPILNNLNFTSQSLLNSPFRHYDIFTNTQNLFTFTMPIFGEKIDDVKDKCYDNTAKIIDLTSELEDATNKIAEYQKNYLKTNDAKWEKLMIQQEKRRDKIEIELNEAKKQHEESIKSGQKNGKPDIHQSIKT